MSRVRSLPDYFTEQPFIPGLTPHNILDESRKATEASKAFRYSFPAFLGLCLVLALLVLLRRFVIGWVGRVRDDNFLVGRKLHNFGVPSSADDTEAEGGGAGPSGVNIAGGQELELGMEHVEE